jgi:hypothetical protein
MKVPIQRSCHKKILKWNMKTLSLTIHEICPMLKFLRSRWNSKVRRAKMKVPLERSCHSFMNTIIIYIYIFSYIYLAIEKI